MWQDHDLDAIVNWAVMEGNRSAAEGQLNSDTFTAGGRLDVPHTGHSWGAHPGVTQVPFYKAQLLFLQYCYVQVLGVFQYCALMQSLDHHYGCMFCNGVFQHEGIFLI